MTSHQLAHLLLEQPDLPVLTYNTDHGWTPMSDQIVVHSMIEWDGRLIYASDSEPKTHVLIDG